MQPIQKNLCKFYKKACALYLFLRMNQQTYAKYVLLYQVSFRISVVSHNYLNDIPRTIFFRPFRLFLHGIFKFHLWL